jgi:hypothetical protein
VVNTQTRPEKLDRLMNINIMIGLKNNWNCLKSTLKSELNV